MSTSTIMKTDPIEFIDRQTPWRQAGQVTSSGMTVMEAMDAAGLLDWNLRKEPLVHLSPTSGVVPVSDKFVNLRDVAGPEKVRSVGVVGDRYWNLPNEVIGEFVQAVVDEGVEEGVYVDAAGSLDGGSRVFMTLGLAGSTVKVGGDDVIMNYLTALWSHDGSTPLVLMPMPTRLACTNQLRGLTRRSKDMYKVRHLTGAGLLTHKVEDARKALKVTSEFSGALAKEAEEFLATSVVDSQFSEMMALAFPEIGKAREGELTGRALTMAENRAQEIWGIWNGATVAGAGIRYTAWGALQAMGEYVDWKQSVKGSGSLGDAAARARRALVNPVGVETSKSHVKDAVLSVVGAK